VRLAKSDAGMWTPIFMLNRENVLDVMDNYIEKMKEFREAIASGNEQKIVSLIEESNKIRKVLDKKYEPELIDG